ncbi:MG010, DNA primase-like protein [uncultured Caudovirales phage]|uniref:MG010, DNA primase-like protein n=1 Tax=uncultured Caudovirales phage TaxID=2100421 RepID=A0A6J5N9L6_9CAUD|nr:MG010, DNA primase-like protein [uncultured Caudovirales phage]CAB4171079.1 MG010, DNA primase-like protein [uncultured Caudovirales phage]CAB4197550.1 MG010, DNA primase-like protein [uncultured Caudovirales phage]
MKNFKLLQLLESVLGKGKPTSGDNIAFFSPFTSHYKPKLEININTNHAGENAWHCWISDKKGRSISSLFKQLNLSKEKFEQLERIVETTRYRSQNTVTEKPTTVQLPEQYRPLWIKKLTPDYRNAIHYLSKRGITAFDILKYRIGYCESGEYSGKIIIPSYDAAGQLNYFVSRAFYKEDKQKHKNPKISKDIIGFEMFINWAEPIILCEGSFDAIAIKRNAIPLFGKIIQPALQKKIIQEHVRDIYICLDADALKNAIQIAQRFMGEGLNVYFVELANEDASELGFEKITNILADTDVLTFEGLMHLKMGMLWA